jgi:hypothetical protein
VVVLYRTYLNVVGSGLNLVGVLRVTPELSYICMKQMLKYSSLNIRFVKRERGTGTGFGFFKRKRELISSNQQQSFHTF